MAVLHHKEQKIQVVLGRLPKNYTHEQFVAMFIQLYSKDWGKIKSAYIKQSQDREVGTVIHMPKPDLYLKQLLETYLKQQPATVIATPAPEEQKAKVEKKEAVKKTAVKASAEKITTAKKPSKNVDATEVPLPKAKAVSTKATPAKADTVASVIKPKATSKKESVKKVEIDPLPVKPKATTKKATAKAAATEPAIVKPKVTRQKKAIIPKDVVEKPSLS